MLIKSYNYILIISKSPTKYKNQMKYYIETNGLRNLNSKLNAVSCNCFTSALSILETISGLRKSSKEYRIRKSVLINLYSSNIAIDWESPEIKKAHAFPRITYNDYRMEGLKKLVHHLISTSDLESFLKETDSEKYNLKYFEELDAFYNKKFIEATKVGNDKIKTHLKNIDKSFDQDYIDFTSGLVKNLPSDLLLNESLTLYSIVENLVDAIEMELKIVIDRKEIYNSYNGNINIFIHYFSLFTATKAASFYDAGHNDYFDLLHLVYLKNNIEYKIVSDDKIFEQNTYSIKVSEFEKLCINSNSI